MLACCRAVPAAPAPSTTERDTRPLPAIGGCAELTAAQRDAALDAFDRLRLREITSWRKNTVSLLAKFQSSTAELGPDERIRLEVEEDMESLKTVLADQHVDKICALDWEYRGKEDVTPIIPLLLSRCPELALLKVDFKRHSASDFVSSVLEHPSNKIAVLEMPKYTKGDIPRFYAALGQSQVSALSLFKNGSPECYQGLSDYLAKDLLVRLKVWMNFKQVPSEVLMSLATCTRLTALNWDRCEFSEPTAFTHPKSIAKLRLRNCTFVGGFDWSFLANGSSMRELGFKYVKDVDGNQLGSALAVLLRAKGLDELRLFGCGFVNETLAAVGGELGRVKRLDFSSLNDASVALIALILQSPNSELRELSLYYVDNIASSIETALRHPNCNLTKLSLSVSRDWQVGADKSVEDPFRNRLRLFALLQGQQVRRRYCPLRRLPVEMFRLVGQVLI